MASKSLVQIVLIILSVVVIFTYIRPTFTEIGELQDEVFTYSDAVAKATEFNAFMNELLAIENSFSVRDMQALETFLPNQIDELAVMGDIETIAALHEEITLVSIKPGTLTVPTPTNVFVPEDDSLDADAEAFREAATAQPALSYQDFVVVVSGTYVDVKGFMDSVSQNAYPLEVVDLTFSAATVEAEEGVAQPTSDEIEYNFSLTLRVSALNS